MRCYYYYYFALFCTCRYFYFGPKKWTVLSIQSPPLSLFLLPVLLVVFIRLHEAWKLVLEVLEKQTKQSFLFYAPK